MRRSFAFSNYDAYRPGGAYFTCDRCSQRFRRTDMFIEWDNLRVDIACLDPRPPQMSIPNVYPEGIPFPDARPPQDRPDRLEDDTALGSIVGGMEVQPGVLHPMGQNGLPGSLSPLPLVETVPVMTDTFLAQETGGEVEQENRSGILLTTTGTPMGPNVLADDITFITGPIPAPMNSDGTTIEPPPDP